jgi:hypothetical protein
MELLWSHGGDIYEIDIGEEFIRPGPRKKFRDQVRDSVFVNFISEYKKFGVNIEEICSILSNSYKPDEKTDSIRKAEKDIDEKSDIYGLSLKGINISDFKEWLEKNIMNIKEWDEKKFSEKESVLRLKDKPFEEMIKLILRLVYRAGVINPIDGEFRNCAILSRNWYSRISQIHESEYNLLPLPLAKNYLDGKEEDVYYRSVTCITFWSLVMLRNALSPEIGGNFIESINAPDYYEERLKNKIGMPLMDGEINKKKFREFDPQSYSILSRIMDNGRKNEETLKKIGDYFHDRDKRENIIEEKEYPRKEEIFDSNKAFLRREFLEVLKKEITDNGKKKKEWEKYLAEHKDTINNRVFYPKLRHSRTAFYQLEQALYYQLKQLFIENPDFRDERLYEGKHIVEEIKKICEDERKKQESEKPIDENKWNDCLDAISHEFRMHVIFELLTYFYHDYLMGADETGDKENEKIVDKS